MFKAKELQFKIPSHISVAEVTYFQVQVAPTSKDSSIQPFQISKRYTQFEELYNDLLKQFPTAQIPPLPSKRFKIFVNHSDPGFIEQRRVLLETFMKKISEADDLMGSNHTKLFLETDRTELISSKSEEKGLDYGYADDKIPSNIGEYVSEEVTAVWIPAIKEMSDHTLFQIHCSNGDKNNHADLSEWVSLKRYQDFVELDEKLRANFPTIVSHFPPLPEKAIRFMTDHNSPAFIEQRRAVLENYLKRMIRIEQVVNDKNFLRFLNADFS